MIMVTIDIFGNSALLANLYGVIVDTCKCPEMGVLKSIYYVREKKIDFKLKISQFFYCFDYLLNKP